MRMIKNSFLKKKFLWLFLCLFFTAMLVPVTATAAEEQIVVHDFALYQGDSKEKLVANIRFDYYLSDYLRESLLNGITLRSEVRFDLVFHSDWWWNKTEQLDSIVSELKYNALTGQYSLFNEQSDKSWNFSNLAAALQHLGGVNGHALPPLPDKAFANDAAVYIEATLEPRASKSLGVPAKLSSLFSKDKYKLTSQGVMWPLTP